MIHFLFLNGKGIDKYRSGVSKKAKQERKFFISIGNGLTNNQPLLIKDVCKYKSFPRRIISCLRCGNYPLEANHQLSLNDSVPEHGMKTSSLQKNTYRFCSCSVL